MHHSRLENVRLAALRRLRWLSAVPAQFRKDLATKMTSRSRALEGINLFERQWMSQNGEDGILQELFRRLGPGHSYFVEFGVGDGLQCNCAYLARYCAWQGLFIEGNAKDYERLAQHYRKFPRVHTAHAFIRRENIAEIFATYNVPQEFDLLSIDIDGNDYWVWGALESYRPRVVVIEYNATYPPPASVVISYNPDHTWNGTTYFGASLTALSKLGAKLGCALLGTDTRGVNAFFVRSDLLSASGFAALTPENAYHPPAYSAIRGGNPWKPGDYETIY
ncbi:MAG: hypothetical protein ACXWNZ_18015 [Vulcanimicrobiaceae bacterium]